MSSSKLFFALTCLLGFALLALAESKPATQKSRDCTCTRCGCGTQLVMAEKKANDNRSPSNESSPSYSLYTRRAKVDKVGGQPLEHWVRKLSDADPSAREDAVLAVLQFGEDAGPYVPKICQVARDHDAAPKVKAIMALGIMYVPETQKSAVYKELGRALMDPNSESIHRYESVKSLLTLMRLRFGPPVGDERQIINNLVTIGGSSRNCALREICIDAIMAAGTEIDKGPDPRVTDFLILRATPFREPAEKVRYKAILALGFLGRPKDPKKLDQVVAVLKSRGNYGSQNRIIRMWTHVSLMALDQKIPPREVEAIVKLLDDPDSRIKIQAVTALGALRSKAEPYVGQICNLVKREKDPMILTIVAQSLGGMENKGPRVLDTLIKITELDEVKYVPAVLAACGSLKELGVNDAVTMQALEKVREHRSFSDAQKDLIKKVIEDIRNPKKPPKNIR